jgi:homoserine O-succinyltransferase/O-acetyltransferase
VPVFVEAAGGRPISARKRNGSTAEPTGAGADAIRIALVNNMPDAALEDTEIQFCDLLADASQGLSVHLKLVALPKVPRTERGIERLKQFYYGVDELWNHEYDAVIITGTEPQQPDLRQEPYWNELTNLFDWAQRNTASTILSCLAAHAGVLHNDGIPREKQPDKIFGVFEFAKAKAPARTSEEVLMRHSPDVLRFPHSRWNGLNAGALTACGYQVLTQNGTAGVDCFVKRSEKSLTVHFQGHPEYQSQTLFKEYRRDVRRFLHRERETYPSAPYGYFSADALTRLKEFQHKATVERSEEIMAEFPEAFVTSQLQNGWHDSAVRVYRKWLEFLSEQKSAIRYAPVRVSRTGTALRAAE